MPNDTLHDTKSFIAGFIAEIEVLAWGHPPALFLWGNMPAATGYCKNKGNSPNHKGGLHLLSFLGEKS